MMIMKKIIFVAAILAIAACAKEAGSGKNDSAKREFDAWIAKNHPDIQPTALGSYILEQIPGTGAPVADSAYVRVLNTVTTLDSTVYTTTSEQLARQLGTYHKSFYYGPVFWYRTGNNLYAGLEELVAGMNVGGAMTVVVPGWLNTFNRYDNASGYIKNVTGNNLIYSFRIVEAMNDEAAWEADSLSRFIAANYPSAVKDTTVDGFWHVVLDPGRPGERYTSDSTVYINYVGRRLDGTIFDTNIADSAKVAGLYSSGSTYSKKKVTLDDDDYTNNQLAGSSVIGGFALALGKLPPGGRILCFFTSANGYGSSSSGSAIPTYCPLCFEIADVED